MKVKSESVNCPTLAIPWTVVYQASCLRNSPGKPTGVVDIPFSRESS